jgi:predicted AAA+ superfamily ATPase
MIQSIRRRIFPVLQKHLDSPEMTLLIGPRQVGKTTLIQMLLRGLEARGLRTVFFNLDVEEDAHWFDSQRLLLDRLEFLVGKTSQTSQTVYVAIDEIQRKKDAGRFMKGLYDMGLPYKFILSGSGSLELKEQIAESMMGRKREFFISPVTFSEFVDYRTSYAYSDRLAAYAHMEPERLLGHLTEYLNYGGYPRVIVADGQEEKRQVLREIYTSYVDRDITALLRLARPDAFRKMLALLASQNGQLLNMSTLAAQVGLSAPTLKNYLYYAEKTFSVAMVQPYFRNAQKEITKAATPYFVDLGLRNLILGKWGTLREPGELGLVFQNLVFHILSEKYPNTPVKYWRTIGQAEVDFVVEDASHSGVLPVEVKYAALKRADITKSLRSFIDKYQPSEAWVINLSLDQSVVVGDTTVQFIPISTLL